MLVPLHDLAPSLKKNEIIGRGKMTGNVRIRALDLCFATLLNKVDFLKI